MPKNYAPKIAKKYFEILRSNSFEFNFAILRQNPKAIDFRILAILRQITQSYFSQGQCPLKWLCLLPRESYSTGFDLRGSKRLKGMNSNAVTGLVLGLSDVFFSSTKIDKVQRRFTKRLRSLKHISHSDRLIKLGLPSLELYGYYILILFTAIKGIFGLVKLNFPDFFEFSVSSTRGHAYKLYKYRCKSARAHFFAC